MLSEKFLVNGKENYRQESLFRKYPLQVGNVTFFVNPHVLSQASPVFEVMTLDEKFVENQNLKACLEDENPEDIEVLLEAVCPTYYGIYPETVTEKTFPILARLADKFLVDGLKCGCEEFILQCHFNRLSADTLLKMLIACCAFNFRNEFKKFLLWQLLKIRKQNFCIDDELKEFSVGQIVHREILSRPYPKHFVVCCNYSDRCQVCRNVFSLALLRCTICFKKMCVHCSNLVCFRSLRSRVNSIFAQIESASA